MDDEKKKLDLSDLKKCECGDTPSGDSNLMEDDEIGVSIMCIRCGKETDVYAELSDAVAAWNAIAADPREKSHGS